MEERFSLALLQCKGSPAPVNLFVVLGRGGKASPVQYKFQSMHPGGRTCVNSLFPVFDIHIKRICRQIVGIIQTALLIAAVCSEIRLTCSFA